MNFKQVLKIVIFMLIVGVECYFLCDLFELKNDYMAQGYASYKAQEKGAVDAVFIGTSGVNRSWIPAKAFDMHGMTVMNLSIDGLPSWTTLDLIKEAYRFQDPKLVILDTRIFTKAEDRLQSDISKVRSRRVIDVLDFFSPNRLSAIDESLNFISEYDEKVSRFDPSFFLSFIQYHGMWADDDYDPLKELGSEPGKYLGFFLQKKRSLVAKEQNEPVWSSETEELPESTMGYLDKIVDYSRENDIELLFVDTPHVTNEEECRRLNALREYLDEKDINYKIYSREKWFLKDEDRDNEKLVKRRFDKDIHFYDASHTNYYGAVIFTRIFADYLEDTYDLPDHSEDPRCESWVGVYSKIKKKVKKWKKES